MRIPRNTRKDRNTENGLSKSIKPSLAENVGSQNVTTGYPKRKGLEILKQRNTIRRAAKIGEEKDIEMHHTSNLNQKESNVKLLILTHQ